MGLLGIWLFLAAALRLGEGGGHNRQGAHGHDQDGNLHNEQDLSLGQVPVRISC